MYAMVQSFDSEIGMQICRQTNIQNIQFFFFQHPIKIKIRAAAGGLCSFLSFFLADITYGDHFCFRDLAPSFAM